MKRTIGLLLAAALLLLSLPIMSVSAEEACYINTHTNTGNQKADLIAVAKTQNGYHEGTLKGTLGGVGSNEYSKYGVWYEENVDSSMDYSHLTWNGSFLSWCAAQADIPQSVIPYYAYVPYTAAWFREQGLWHDADGYTPMVGDLVFFGGLGTSVAIVCEVSNKYLMVVKGDDFYLNGEQVFGYAVYDFRYRNSTNINGYATPNYADNSASVNYEATNIRRAAAGTTVAQLLQDTAVSDERIALVYRDVTRCTDGNIATGMALYITDGVTIYEKQDLVVAGDVNGDGLVSTADVRDILCDSWSQRNAAFYAADMDGNNAVTTSDARLLIRAVAASQSV